MAKKKKAALKPNPARGFATTSVPSKKEDPPSGASSGTTTPRLQTAAEQEAARSAADELGLGTGVVEDAIGGHGKGKVQEWTEEMAEEMALQVVTDRVWDRSEKEAARLWKIIEYDRRLAASLPSFMMDTALRDQILSHIPADPAPSQSQINFSSLVPNLTATSSVTSLLSRGLTTYSLLLRLGFTPEQGVQALSNTPSADVDDCLAWLWTRLDDEEVDRARARCNRGEQMQEAEDPTIPPKHDGFSFERGSPQKIAPQPKPAEAPALILELSPGELAARREAIRQCARNALALAVELEKLEEEGDALENPIGAYASSKAGLVRLDRVSAALSKAKVAGNESEAPGPLRAEVREAERRVELVRPPLERTRDAVSKGKWFDKKAGEEAFRLEMEKDKERQEQERLEIEQRAKDERAAQGLSDTNVKPNDDVAVPAVTAPDTDEPVAPKQPIDAGDTPMSASASDAGSEDGSIASDGMFGDMLNETPTQITDEETGGVVHLWPLPQPVLKGGGGGKLPRSLLNEALRRVDMAASAKYQALGSQSVCRAALTLRWTPPGVGKVVVDTYKLTGIGAGSPSAAEELLAIVALTCMERDRHYERSLGKGWREWWDEVESARKAGRDAQRRAHVEKIGSVLVSRLEEERLKAEERDKLKKANAAAAAASAPVEAVSADVSNGDHPTGEEQQKEIQAPSAVKPHDEAEAEATRAMWQRTTSTDRFAKMLPGRQGLPIAKFKETILQTLHNNQIFVLSGETGCGKSTQVPAYIVEACMAAGQPCKVYVTEPRRISAISLAERVSQELGEAPNSVGSDESLIGSGVRLDSKIGRNARLVYATTGIVLRMLESGRLEGVTHIVLDEVHERSIESDFLLIILKTLMQVRADLKVILMSATLDAERISTYFGGCPTIAVPGRTFPVDVRYLEDAVELTDYTIEDGSPYARRPKRWNDRKADVPGNRAKLTSTEAEDEAPDMDDDDDQDGPASTTTTEEIRKYRPKTISTLDRMDENVIQHELIIALLERICFEDDTLRPYSPAILIFMPGIADIRKLTDLLNGHRSFGSQSFRVFPLHSTISNEDQGSVFNVPPKGVRKIVIATNIAETGITIPDITCVVDSGKHREMRFDEKRQLSRLVECFVAKSNAKQRRGRAGRVQEGLCFHLFTKLRHDKYFADHPLPEMLRLSLQDLALKLKVMKVRIGTSIEDALSKAMDPPSSVNIHRAIAALVEVKALTASEEITALGRHLSRLPLDVHMGKFLLIAALVGALDPALTIAATLNSKSPFITPFGREAEADRAKASFKAGDSDFVTYAKAFAAWRRAIDNNFARQFCTKNFLGPQHLQGIEELRLQYFGYLLDSGFVSVSGETKQELAKARFRSGRHVKPLLLPEHLSLNANSLAVLNAALCAGLYPKLLAIDPRSYQIRTIGNNAPAAIHPSSVNFRARLGDLPKGFNHLIYFTLMQSRKLYAWETGAVDDRGIILMCGDADFKVTSSSLFIDRQRIRFFIPDSKTLLALRLLRDQLSKLINSSFRNPGREWSEGQRVYFDLATQALGMGATDKDKVMQS